ncbi:hypothetical protein N201_06895 [Helicobacter pylori UM066]|nr:hypothetical protein N201_06895 [Helicobacter pylori UM066]
MFYRFSTHFIVKVIFFIFFKGIERLFEIILSPFNPTKSPLKKALFKNYRLN